MVRGHAAEVFRSRLLVEPEQMIRIELVGLPYGNNILIADARGVAVCLDVIFVLLMSLDIHIAGVPVAVFDCGLRSPMRPDAEFGVAVPVGRLPFLERFARALEWSRRDVE